MDQNVVLFFSALRTQYYRSLGLERQVLLYGQQAELVHQVLRYRVATTEHHVSQCPREVKDRISWWRLLADSVAWGPLGDLDRNVQIRQCHLLFQEGRNVLVEEKMSVAINGYVGLVMYTHKFWV